MQLSYELNFPVLVPLYIIILVYNGGGGGPEPPETFPVPST